MRTTTCTFAIALAIPTMVTSALLSSYARAETPRRFEPGLASGFALAGGTTRCVPDPKRGGCYKASGTGGATLGASGRALLALGDNYDLYGTLSAAAVLAWAPSGGIDFSKLGAIGEVWAGLAVHPATRAWTLGAGPTFAGSYMDYCNASWCYRQVAPTFGGAAYFSAKAYKPSAESGLSLSGEVKAGVVYYRADAFDWWSVQDQPLSHVGVQLGGGITMTF